MIYTIYPCPISIFPWIYFSPYHFAPLIFFAPPLIIFPLYYFAPPGNRLIIYTIYPCPTSFFLHTIYPFPISFCPLDWALGVGLLCFNRMLGQMLRCYFVFILIKSPLKQKLMTGAHPVTVAPLVGFGI